MGPHQVKCIYVRPEAWLMGHRAPASHYIRKMEKLHSKGRELVGWLMRMEPQSGLIFLKCSEIDSTPSLTKTQGTHLSSHRER